MAISIPEAVRQMLAIVAELCVTYPKKKFTLDGRLVGDIGEILIEDSYDLSLFENIQKHHDAACSAGRLVQIKATMKKAVGFPADHVPDYYLAVQIHADGTFTEVFNGPGAIAQRAIEGRAVPKNNLYSVRINALKKLQPNVPPSEEIALRSNKVTNYAPSAQDAAPPRLL